MGLVENLLSDPWRESSRKMTTQVITQALEDQSNENG